MSAATFVQTLVELEGDLIDECDDYGALNPDALAIMLVAIRDARASLAKMASVVEGELIAQAGNKRFTVEGIGEVEILKSTKRRNWANHDLTKVVVSYALDERIIDPATGEYEPAHEAVARVLEDCSRPSWRLTPLRARGIDPDEFCDVEPDGFSVKLPSAKVDT